MAVVASGLPTVVDLVGAWASGSSAFSINNQAAAFTFGGGVAQGADTFIVDTFGFSVPAGATITNVEVKIVFNYFFIAGIPNEATLGVALRNGATSSSSVSAADLGALNTASAAFQSFHVSDSPANWGITLTPDIVNSADFGVQADFYFDAGADMAGTIAKIDALVVTLTYEVSNTRTFYKTTSVYRCGNKIQGK